MFAKLANPAFLTDMRPLLPADRAAQLTDEAAKAAVTSVFSQLVARIPGDPWVRTPEMCERFGIEA